MVHEKLKLDDDHMKGKKVRSLCGRNEVDMMLGAHDTSRSIGYRLRSHRS